jgi:hypothetical protein
MFAPIHCRADAPQPPSVALITLAEYRGRLQAYDQLVQDCQQAILPGKPADCHGEHVEPEFQVALPSGARQVRYGWLRDLLNSANREQSFSIKIGPKNSSNPPQSNVKQAQSHSPQESPDDAPDKEDSDDSNTSDKSAGAPAGAGEKPTVDLQPATLAERLSAARSRLAEDEKLATAAEVNSSSGTKSEQKASKEVHLLTEILSAKEFNTVQAKPTIKDKILEKIGNWIDKGFSKMMEVGAKSKWFGLTAEIGFVLLLCVGLVWLLIRLERQGRLASQTIEAGPGTHAASTRDWQLWLRDARQAADAAAWREAIHFLYWASISKLESSGLWPADRALTPREYLAVLPKESIHRSNLTALTRSFERTWYAGLPASESDFLQAETLAAKLGAQMHSAQARIAS